jgi:hypothetical protein
MTLITIKILIWNINKKFWILSLIINQIIIVTDVYRHMLIMTKHHFTCD